MKEKNRKASIKIDQAIDEVLLLAEEDYIDVSTYEAVKKGFDAKLLALEEREKEELAQQKAAEVAEKELQLSEATTVETQEQGPPALKKPVQTQPVRPTIVKKQRTPEENRKRRLTYILTSGVALLLLGGVLLALTNWLVLAPVTKVFLISGIAVLFAGMSYVAHRLKIKQTMLAFLMLFAFFVPIVFFSISYYGIFGDYLSMGGEGSLLFAALSSLTCAVLYAFLYSIEANRTFQIVALLATASSMLYTAGFVSSTVETYVLVLVIFGFVQLFLWNKAMGLSALQSYRVYLPWFILAQIILATFIQFILFDWSRAGFGNYALLGILYYWFALKQPVYRILSIPAVLTFSIGVTGFIFWNANEYDWYNALLTLVLPTILLAVYQIEKKKTGDALLYMPIQIIFFVTIFFTHTFSQLMLLDEYFSPNLYGVTMCGTVVLLISAGWLAKQRVTLFFGYLLASYSIWYLLSKYLNSISTKVLMYVSLFVVLYVATIFLRKLDTRLIRHPIKLISAMSLGMISFELAVFLEWWLLTGVLLGLAILATVLFKYEVKAYQRVLNVCGVIVLFFAVITSYFARASESIYLAPLDTTVHFIVGAGLLSGLHFAYKKWQGMQTAIVSYASGGLLYLIVLMTILYHYLVFANEYPIVLTGYLLAGVLYFLVAAVVIFKESGYYAGVLAFALLTYMSLLNTVLAETTVGFWTILLLSGGVFIWIGKGIKRSTSLGGTLFYVTGHILLFTVGLFYTLFIFVSDLNVHGLLVPFVFFIVEVIRSKKRAWRLAQSLCAGIFLLIHNLIWFRELPVVTGADSLLLTGGIILLCMLWKPLSYQRKGIVVGLVLLNLYPISLLLWEATTYGIIKIVIVFAVSIASIYYLEEKLKRGNYTVIPYAFASLVVLFGNESTLLTVILLVALAFAGKAAGVYYVGWSFISSKRVNSYQIISTLLILFASLQLRGDQTIGTAVELTLATILFAYLVLLFIKEPNKGVRFVKAATLLIGFYYPYSLFLTLLPIADEYMVFIYTVPCMLLVSILLRMVAKDYSWRPPVEMVTVVLGFIVMSLSTLANQTLYGSLTLSILAVLAILAGFYLKYAAYFITGVVALLVNTLYATRTFWASVPWWVYLMAGGAILIGFATYQELKKREEDTSIKDQWNQLMRKLKNYFTHWK
ncbi:hypothetical protein MKX54_04250 [Alkalihalobacillus sp. FSL R5-0424]